MTIADPTAAVPQPQGFVLASDEGDAFWWLDSLTITKVAGSRTLGGLSIVDHRVPAGYAPPPHVHDGSDEVFYILDGTFSVKCGDQRWQAEPGSLVFLPRGVPHGFRVSDAGPGRTLLINAPAGFEDVVRELGTPAVELRLPDPDEPKPAPTRIGEVAGAYGIAPAPESFGNP